MRLALYQPDIPQNLGANLRLAACFGVAVDLIGPCGFPLTHRALMRASMDYGEMVDVKRHDGWSRFIDSHRQGGGRLVLLTTGGEAELGDFRFRSDDCLLFGRESAGVPAEVHDSADARVRIPIRADARSLNVAMAAGIALWEALRQTAGPPYA